MSWNDGILAFSNSQEKKLYTKTIDGHTIEFYHKHEIALNDQGISLKSGKSTFTIPGSVKEISDAIANMEALFRKSIFRK